MNITNMPRKRAGAGAGAPSTTSRLSRYHGAVTGLNTHERGNDARVAELSYRLRVRKNTLQALPRDSDAELFEGLAILEQYTASVDEASTVVHNEAESLIEEYKDFNKFFNQLDVEGPIAIGLKARNDEILATMTRLNDIIDECKSQADSTERSLLRKSLIDLRAENDQLRSAQQNAQSLLLETCGRDRAVASAIFKNQDLATTGRELDLESSVRWLKCVLDELSTDKQQLQVQLQESSNVNARLQQELQEAKAEVSGKDASGQALTEQVQDLTDKKSAHHTERLALEVANTELRSAMDKVQADLNAKTNRDQSTADLIACITSQYQRILNEADKSREKNEILDREVKALRASSLQHESVQALLQHTLSNSERSQAEFAELTKTYAVLQASESELKTQHTELQHKLARSEQEKKLAESEMTAARERAKDRLQQVQKRFETELAAMTATCDAAVKEHETAAKHHQTRATTIHQNKQILEREVQSITDRANDLAIELDQQKQKALEQELAHTDEITTLNTRLVDLRATNSVYHMQIDGGDMLLAEKTSQLEESTKRLLLTRWRLAVKGAQLEEAWEIIDIADTKLTHRAKQLARLKEEYDEVLGHLMEASELPVA